MANVTKPIALDETLQAVNETLGEIRDAIGGGGGDETLSHITPQEYSTSTSYTIGTLCMHNGYMYQCNTATSGTWNPAYWTQVRIGNMAALSYTVVSTY